MARKTTRPPRKATKVDIASLRLSELRKKALGTIQDNLQAKKTRMAYEGYIRRGKQFCASVSPDGGLDIRNAFDEITEATPYALLLFAAYYHESIECNSKSTDALKSAAVDYFKRQFSLHQMFWEVETSSTGEKLCRGNPAYDITFSNYIRSLRKKDARSNHSRQSLPLTLSNLAFLLKWLRRQTRAQQLNRTSAKYKWLLHYLPVAWFLASRSSELCDTTLDDLEFDQEDEFGHRHHLLTFCFTKTNQDDPTETRSYELHAPTVEEELHVDPLACMDEMRKWLDAETGGNYDSEVFIFPALDGQGGLKPNKAMPVASLNNIFSEAVHKSGLAAMYPNGKFTSHCMRRGAAQYRLFFAKDCWDMEKLRWWCRWSPNCGNDTVFRYLFQEIEDHRLNYSNLMNPNRSLIQASSAKRSFSVKHRPILEATKCQSSSGNTVTKSLLRPHASKFRIPRFTTVEAAYKDWHMADPSRKLLAPLKDWPTHPSAPFLNATWRKRRDLALFVDSLPGKLDDIRSKYSGMSGDNILKARRKQLAASGTQTASDNAGKPILRFSHIEIRVNQQHGMGGSWS